jgi:hypothetical protein
VLAKPHEGPIVVEKYKTTYLQKKIQKPEKRETVGFSGLYCQICLLFLVLRKIKIRVDVSGDAVQRKNKNCNAYRLP